MVKIEKIDEDFFIRYPNTPPEYRDFIGQFDVELSKESSECHFLQFMINTGDFFWRKHINERTREAIPDARTKEELFETNLHLISKMTALGYLFHKYRDKSVEKAIIAMDGKVSEVGESNGRTGKSILGFAVGKVIPSAYIGAKAKDLTEDPFLFEEVNEKIDNVFIDDVRPNIDFEFFFPIITGKMSINQKGLKKFTLSESDTPKIYLTTNHAINGSTSSFKDRQSLIAFSDYYSDHHKPIDDFGINFFDEWDEKQYNYFYNFMANCLQLYFQAAAEGWGANGSGLIEPPTQLLETRRIRQFIGEDFLTWADEYFGLGDSVDPETVDTTLPVCNLNREIKRVDIFVDFFERNPGQRKYVTPQKFKNKLKQYCLYRKVRFNPQQQTPEGHPGGDHKKGGVEFRS